MFKTPILLIGIDLIFSNVINISFSLMFETPLILGIQLIHIFNVKAVVLL